MTAPDQPATIEHTATSSPQGPVDPSITTTLEGSDDSVAPTQEQLAFGAAGDVEGLQVTPQPAVDHAVTLQDTVGQQDRT